MRGSDDQTNDMFSYVSPEQRVRADWSSQDLVDSKSVPKEGLTHVHEAARTGASHL